MPIGLDRVETRQPVRRGQHQTGVDALRRPGCAQPIAERVGAQCGEQGGVDAPPRQIDGRVVAIAAMREAPAAVRAAQLEHALADRNEAPQIHAQIPPSRIGLTHPDLACQAPGSWMDRGRR